MKRSLHLLVGLAFLFGIGRSYAQTTLATGHTPNNGSTAITFEVSSTTSINIIGFANTFNSGTVSAEVWYRVGGVLHPGATTPSVTAGNGWVQLVSTSVSGNGTTPVSIPGTYQLSVGAGQTIGVCITGGTRYHNYTASDPTFVTDNTLTITTGPPVGFGGSFPNPTIQNRQFAGSVTYQFAGPCVNPPYVGSAISDKSQTCAGERFTLSLDTLTSGLGQTYQWQSSPDSLSWSNITGATFPFLDTSQTSTTYYRCYITCSASDTSDAVKVETNTTPLTAGTYTINSGSTTGGTNFASFNDFANLISCSGITGPILVNVVPGTGPYSEQVTFGSVSGASSTNTITINGNGEKLQFASSNTNERATLKMDGTQYLYVKNLEIEATGSSYGWGVWLTNGTHHVGIDSSYIKIPTSTTSSFFAGFVTSLSSTSPTTAGLAAWEYSLTNSIIEGGYYGCVVNGPTTPPYSTNNVIENNEIRDFYVYGMYIRGQENGSISYNSINRASRSTITTFYGMLLTGSMAGTELSGNRVHDNATMNLSSTSSAYGYYFSSVTGGGTAPVVFSNNLLYNINNLGTIYGIYLTGISDSILFYHNSFNLDNSTPGGSGTIRGLYSVVSSGNFDFRNNIWNMTDVGTGSKHILYLSSTSPNYTFNYNQFYMDPGWGIFGYYSGDRNDFNSWVSNTGFEANGIFGNPLFISPGTGDLTPATNVGNNNGANVLAVVPTDINGVARTTSPDRGAYEFSPLPCLQPAIIFSTSTDTSITLSWVNDPLADSVRIEWGPEGFLQGTGDSLYVVATDTSYTFGPLSSLTCFDFYIQTWCGVSAGNGQAKVTACTDCPAILPLPLVENFDGGFWAAGSGGNGDAFDPCWARDPENFGTYSWRVNSGTTSSGSTGPSGDNTTGSGNYLYTEASYGTSGDSAMILSPGMDLSSIQRPMIEFYYHMYGAQIDAMHLDIWDGDQWVRDIWTVSGSPMNASNDPFNKATVLLQPYQNDTVMFRWRAYSLGCCGGDMAIDDISVISAPICTTPTSLVLNSVTSSSANVGWASYSTTFNIEYGPCGFLQGSGVGTVVNNVSNPVNITGLNPNTCYDVYVNDPCNGTWEGPMSFQTLCTSQLSGNYTIGGPVGPNNFVNVDTVASLLNSCGISGPVTFTLFPGTYLGDITIGAVMGSSPTNTITFVGTAADQDTIKGSGSGTAALHLMGARHIIFKKLTIDNSTGPYAIWISDDARDIVIDSCNVNGDGTAVSSLIAAIVATSSSTSTSGYAVNGSDITISNSRIVGGYYGLRINGASTANRTRNYNIINNQFISQYVYAMYFYYSDSLMVHRNVVAGTRSPNGYGIYMGYPCGLDIQQNSFNVGVYGIYGFQVNTNITPVSPGIIANNMIIGGTYGLYLSTATDLDVFHNSIVGGTRGVYCTGSNSYMDFRNNILTSNNNGHAFYASTTLNNSELDYNIYFTGGSLLARNGAVDYTDLNSWKSAQTGINVNSLQGDPGFTSASDLHVLGSLANDVGDNSVGISVDIDDDPRPAIGSTVVDIGADEYTPASCLPVTNFRLLSGGVGTATVKWDSVSNVQSYVIEYGPNGFTPGSGTVVTTTADSAVISGLPMNNLVHEAYIRVHCSGTDTSIAVGPIKLLTEAILCPDDFEAYSTGLIEGQSTLFFGWANQGGDGSVSTTYAKSGTNSMRVYNSGPKGYTDIVAVFPAITSGAHKLKWDFYVPSGFGGYYNIQQNYVGGGAGNIWALEVYILSNGTVRVEPGSVGSGTVGTFNYNVGQWNTLEHVIDLDNDTAFIVCNGVPTGVGWQFSFGSTTNPIQFNGVNFYSTADPGQTPNYYVDDFCVETFNFAACTAPISLGANNVGCDTAQVEWVSGLNAISSFMEYGPAGFTPGSGTILSGSSPIQISGLTPGTSYDAYVWDSCASGYGDTSAVLNFTTATGPLPSPSFTYSSTFTLTTQTVTFDASGSSNATNYYWDFGAGNLDTGSVVSNIYSGPGGPRTVTLTLENGCGTTDTTFTINILVDIKENLLSRSLVVYPNPTSGEFSLEFSLDGVQKVRSRVLNILGQELVQTDHGSLSGNFKFRYDLNGQPSGIYLLEIISEKGTVTRRITLEQ